jgi:hypothetical protein
VTCDDDNIGSIAVIEACAWQLGSVISRTAPQAPRHAANGSTELTQNGGGELTALALRHARSLWMRTELAAMALGRNGLHPPEIRS